MSLRLTAFQQRQDFTVGQDLGVHIEAGLLPNLGLHIRSDGIKTSPYALPRSVSSQTEITNSNDGL